MAELKKNKKLLNPTQVLFWSALLTLGIADLRVATPNSTLPVREAGILDFLKDIFKIDDKRGHTVTIIEDDGSGPPDDGYEWTYIPPEPPPEPIPIEPDQGKTVGVNEVGAGKTEQMQPFVNCYNVGNARERVEDQDIGVFVPTATQAEFDSFVRMPPPSVNVSPCAVVPPPPPPVPVAVRGNWIRVASTSETHAAACKRMNLKPASGTGLGSGICAAIESRPSHAVKYGTGSKEIWTEAQYARFPGKYKGFTNSGGITITGKSKIYCYKKGQKQDNDSTDVIAAYLCVPL